MSKGSIGTSMSGSIVYTRSKKSNSRKKICNNCGNIKQPKDASSSHRGVGFCPVFGITISDPNNAKVCKSYISKHAKRKNINKSSKTKE